MISKVTIKDILFTECVNHLYIESLSKKVYLSIDDSIILETKVNVLIEKDIKSDNLDNIIKEIEQEFELLSYNISCNTNLKLVSVELDCIIQECVVSIKEYIFKNTRPDLVINPTPVTAPKNKLRKWLINNKITPRRFYDYYNINMSYQDLINFIYKDKHNDIDCELEISKIIQEKEEVG